MIKIMSNRDKIVGMKSMFWEKVGEKVQWYQMNKLTDSPLVSSQRPNTELAAAKTEQRELSVVVIPAWRSEYGDKMSGGWTDKILPLLLILFAVP